MFYNLVVFVGIIHATDDNTTESSESYDDKIYPIAMLSADTNVDDNNNENYEENEEKGEVCEEKTMNINQT